MIKKGDTFYRFNRKTKEIDFLNVVDILYVFDKKIGSRANFTQEEIRDLLEDGTITDDVDILKKEAIRKIEEQFNIKLKEV